MNQQNVKTTSGIKPALSILFAASYMICFASFLDASTGLQASEPRATVTYTVSFKAPVPSAVAGASAEVASVKIPGTCDLLQNTQCDVPAAASHVL